MYGFVPCFIDQRLHSGGVSYTAVTPAFPVQFSVCVQFHMGSLCLCGFAPGFPASSHISKNMPVWRLATLQFECVRRIVPCDGLAYYAGCFAEGFFLLFFIFLYIFQDHLTLAPESITMHVHIYTLDFASHSILA